MSFTSPLKKCRCETDGIITSIKVALVKENRPVVRTCEFALGGKKRTFSGLEHNVECVECVERGLWLY